MTVWKPAHTASGINMPRVKLAAGFCVVSATQALSHTIDESVSFLFNLSNVHCSHRGSLMGPLNRLSLYVTTVCQDPLMQQVVTRFLWNSACRPSSFSGVKVKGYRSEIRNSGWAQEGKQSASLCHNRQLLPDHLLFLNNKPDCKFSMRDWGYKISTNISTKVPVRKCLHPQGSSSLPVFTVINFFFFTHWLTHRITGYVW